MSGMLVTRRGQAIIFSALFLLLMGAVAAHAASGDLMWGRAWKSFNGKTEQAKATGVDSGGNIYVTGGSGQNFATVKYTSTGTRKWARSYDGPAGGRDLANDLAVQGENILITGFSRGVGTGLDYTTIKYRKNGARAWVKRFDGPAHGKDYATAVAADAAGNVYVTGASRRASTRLDYVTIKYGPNGSRLWAKRYDGPAHGKDIAQAISVDATGNVFVTGRSQGATSGADYATVMYNPSGARQWVKRYDGPAGGFDGAVGVSVDATGNVFVTGTSAGAGTGRDYATIMYSSSGAPQWISRYNGQGAGADVAKAMTIDSSGHAIVTGSSEGTTTNEDYATVQYGTDGAERWVSRYNGAGNLADTARAISVDSSNNVFVTGTVSDNDGADAGTIRYNPAGAQDWVKRYGSVLPLSVYGGTAIANNASGVYVVGGLSDRFNKDILILAYDP